MTYRIHQALFDIFDELNSTIVWIFRPMYQVVRYLGLRRSCRPFIKRLIEAINTVAVKSIQRKNTHATIRFKIFYKSTTIDFFHNY